MKVIHVLSDSNIGGAGVLLINCLKHFDREKFDIKVILPKDSKLVPKVTELGYPIIETQNGRDKSYDRAAVPELTAIFRAEKPDIVHTHSSLSARIAAKKAKVPCVFQTHHCAVEPPHYKTVFPGKQLFGLLNNRLSDRIIATAETAKDILVRQGTNARKITVIINGSEPLRTPSEKEQNELRENLGLDGTEFIIGIVARLEEVKDHRTLLESAAEATKTHPQMRFLIIGKGSLEISLKTLAKDLGIDKKVIFCGFSDDIAPYVSLFDVNVNCSTSETSCLALSEGMSLGKPSVVSDCEGNTAMVENGVNGLVFEVGNSEMLATALITLAENKQLCKKMGKKALEIYESRYTAEVMTRKLEILYETELHEKYKNK